MHLTSQFHLFRVVSYKPNHCSYLVKFLLNQVQLAIQLIKDSSRIPEELCLGYNSLTNQLIKLRNLSVHLTDSGWIIVWTPWGRSLLGSVLWAKCDEQGRLPLKNMTSPTGSSLAYPFFFYTVERQRSCLGLGSKSTV